MFSVLILNKKTTESFNEYYPLFLSAIKRNDVAVCRWYENGSDINSALPDLHDLTDDKKEWRAIIVKTEDDIDSYPYYPENPFDYSVNKDGNESIKESTVPLIRLTHYLGGFPSPDVTFVPEELHAEGKTNRVIYKPNRDADKVELYNKLSAKYSFDGRNPNDIIIVTLRNIKSGEATNNLKTAWTDYNEINSSVFWKRNNYPSNCRFVVFDMKQDGPIQREADMFSFWTVISLLSTNNINPNYLQAYRLYKTSVVFSSDNMQFDMQTTVTQLIGARHYIEKSIQQDIENKLNEKRIIPNYEVNVPVVINAPSKTDFGIKTKRFPLTPSSDFEDNLLWNNMKLETFESLDECIENSERALDESADSMRRACSFPEELIKPLDKYQLKDMNSDLANEYSKIIMLQGMLPKTSVHYQEKLVEKEEKIKKIFKQRITNSLSIKTIALLSLLLFIGLIPAAYCYSTENFGKIEVIAMVFAISVLLVGLIELFVLVFQKGKLNEKINSYNESLRLSVGELNNNAKIYSKFISSIASYTKGKYYLRKLSTMKFEDENSYKMQRTHLKAINSLLSRINRWVTAFYLDVSFDINDEENFVIDCVEKPQTNITYTFFSTNQTKKVAINNSGDYIESPFDFVERLCLEREELYDEYRD